MLEDLFFAGKEKGLSGHKHKVSRKNTKKKSLTADEKAKALSKASDAFKSANPFFMLAMQPSYTGVSLVSNCLSICNAISFINYFYIRIEIDTNLHLNYVLHNSFLALRIVIFCYYYYICSVYHSSLRRDILRRRMVKLCFKFLMEELGLLIII